MAMSQAVLDWSRDPPHAQSDSVSENVLAQVLSETPDYLSCSEQDFNVHMEDLE